MLNVNIFAPVSNHGYVMQFCSSCQIQLREDKRTVQENKDSTFIKSFSSHMNRFFLLLRLPPQCKSCRLLTNWFAGSKGLMKESMRRMDGTEIHFFGVVTVYRFRLHKNVL